MKKLFIISLSISLLISSLAFAYYLLIYIPQRDRSRLDEQASQDSEKSLQATLKSQVIMDCSQRIFETAKTTPGTLLMYHDLMNMCLQSRGYSN